MVNSELERLRDMKGGEASESRSFDFGDDLFRLGKLQPTGAYHKRKRDLERNEIESEPGYLLTSGLLRRRFGVRKDLEVIQDLRHGGRQFSFSHRRCAGHRW